MNLQKRRSLTIPGLMFVVGTRAALGAGIGLLAGGRLPDRVRRRAGVALALIGVATTLPAARIAFGHRPSLLERAKRRLT